MRALEEVVSRVTAQAQRDHAKLETAIADTLYHERLRLQKAPPSRARSRRQAELDRARRRMVAGSDAARRAILRDLVEYFALEVLGNFDPRVHQLATRAIPVGLSALLHATSPTLCVLAPPAPPTPS